MAGRKESFGETQDWAVVAHREWLPDLEGCTVFTQESVLGLGGDGTSWPSCFAHAHVCGKRRRVW